jgi:hypothetical protein
MSGKEGSVENLQNLNLVTGPLDGQGIDRVYREKNSSVISNSLFIGIINRLQTNAPATTKKY